MSRWAFYRRAAAVMAADLTSRADTGLTAQLYGDAHVLNFGLWATPGRHLSFDLRDFDETLSDPLEWDVSRHVASIIVLASECGLNANIAERAMAQCLQTYKDRIAHYAGARQLDIRYQLITASGSLRCSPPRNRSRSPRTSSAKRGGEPAPTPLRGSPSGSTATSGSLRTHR